MTKWRIDWVTLIISEKKNNEQHICTGCGAILDDINDFMVHSVLHNVTLCKDCYIIPRWYELINK